MSYKSYSDMAILGCCWFVNPVWVWAVGKEDDAAQTSIHIGGSISKGALLTPAPHSCVPFFCTVQLLIEEEKDGKRKRGVSATRGPLAARPVSAIDLNRESPVTDTNDVTLTLEKIQILASFSLYFASDSEINLLHSILFLFFLFYPWYTPF